MDESDKAIVDHVRGAIVQTTTPFSGLELPSTTEWDEAFYEKWCVPFYGSSFSHRLRDEDLREAFARRCVEVTPDTIDRLLRSSGWRGRTVGAWMAAVQRSDEFHSLMVPLFLRSDVCFAGCAYVLALVRNGSARSVDALECYCEYYLSRPDLGFDQGHAFAGLVELVGLENPRVQTLLPLWSSWCEGHSHRSLERAQKRLWADLERLDEVDSLIAALQQVPGDE